MPVDTPHVYGAMGTTQTCSLVGFLEMCGVGAVMYNASLSFYYLVRIRHGWSTSRIQQKYGVELSMHVIPISFALMTMFAGLFLDLYNSGLFDCWIAPFPQGCTESWRLDDSSSSSNTNSNGDGEEQVDNMNPCQRGDNASLYQWVFDLIPKWTSILIVTINMVLVHAAVLRQERSTLRRTFRGAAHAQAAQYHHHHHPNTTAATTTTTPSVNGTTHDDGSSSTRIITTTTPGPSTTGLVIAPTTTTANPNPITTTSADAAPASSATTTTATDSHRNDTAARSTSTTATPPHPAAATATATTPRSSILLRNRSLHRPAPPTARLSRRLARQSYLYVGALYITYIPVIVTRAFELTRGYVHYEMLLTISITIPLQGFWNGT
jgi:hypothetical protein